MKGREREEVSQGSHHQNGETCCAMESETLDPTLLMEEQRNFAEYQKNLKKEEGTWRLKSRSLWLQARDKNTKFF